MKMFSSLKSQLAAFKSDESGATLIEYVLVIVLIIIAAVVTIGGLTTNLKLGLDKISNNLK